MKVMFFVPGTAAIPFSVLWQKLPLQLCGWALLKPAMVCHASYEEARALIAKLRAAWREIASVARYLQLAPLCFPGFGRRDRFVLRAINQTHGPLPMLQRDQAVKELIETHACSGGLLCLYATNRCQ